MIENDKQLRTRLIIENFKEAVETMAKEPGSIHPLLVKAQIDAANSQIQELETEIAKYLNRRIPNENR